MKTPRANGSADPLGPREPHPEPGALSVVLDGSGHPAGVVGGKAAALDSLVASGFRVPSSGALTSQAYRRFVRSSGLNEWLVRLARRRPRISQTAAAENDEVERAFLEAPLTDDVREALEWVWSSVSEGGRVAVRSSATAEDMAASSFAGQYLSVLEVDGLEAVEVAVKRVWASLWGSGARAYRRRMRVDGRRLAMGVVIQQMIPALHSGVCFTLDPTLDRALRIEAVRGLGDQLVSGSTTPMVHQLSLPSLKSVSAGEVEPELREIARTALRIQEEMGNRPQDVEWSVAEDGLWVLQARPITTLSLSGRPDAGDGFDTRVPGALYSPTGIGEMLPGVLPPLVWTMNGPMVEEGFRKFFSRLRALPASLGPAYSILGRIDGQATLNVSAIKESVAKLSGGTGAEIERGYLGRVVSDEPSRSKSVGPITRSSSALRLMKLRKRVEREAELFERAADAVTALEPRLSEMLTKELVAYRARLRDLAASGVSTQVGVATVAVTTYAGLESMLDRWTGAGAEWAQRVTRGSAISQDPVTTATARVWDRFKGSPAALAIAEAIAEGEPGTFEDRLAGSCAQGAEFACQLRAELDRLGSSAVYGGLLWTEQRGYVWSVVMRWLTDSTADSGSPSIGELAKNDLEELETTVMKSWRWRAKRIVTGQVIDIRRRLLHEMIADTQRLLHRRETLKARLLALGGVERRVILELGKRLVRRGQLKKEKDVQLLADWELDDVALGRAGVDSDVLQARSEALVVYQSGPVLTPLLDDTLESIVPERSDVTGWPASPGKHRGRVRIVKEPSEAGGLRSGDVLVASATDPSWTPLFMLAGAIVVERGGPLSHAAIVSRELGVPAVLNASGATVILAEGALVEVDGNAGTITLVNEAALEEVV